MTQSTAKFLGFFATLLLLAAAPASEPWAKVLELTARAVPLNANAPEQTRIGRLVWRGGLAITSPNDRFGGLSGLLISSDGTKLTAVSDEGFWITATVTYGNDGSLAGLTNGQIKRLRGTNGKILSGKTLQDAESLTGWADGSFLVGYERDHRIWIYSTGKDPLASKATALPAPPGLADLPGNSGLESLATLADGRILAIAEGNENDNESPAFLWRDGAWSRLRYARVENYRPSDAARLPSGDLLIVERRYTVLEGVGIRLVTLPAAAVVPGAVLQPVEIARLLPPLTIDNMEGVSVRRNERGETLIYLVSDDNFSIVQRTLLLMFALEE